MYREISPSDSNDGEIGGRRLVPACWRMDGLTPVQSSQLDSILRSLAHDEQMYALKPRVAAAALMLSTQHLSE